MRTFELTLALAGFASAMNISNDDHHYHAEVELAQVSVEAEITAALTTEVAVEAEAEAECYYNCGCCCSCSCSCSSTDDVVVDPVSEECSECDRECFINMAFWCVCLAEPFDIGAVMRVMDNDGNGCLSIDEWTCLTSCGNHYGWTPTPPAIDYHDVFEEFDNQ